MIWIVYSLDRCLYDATVTIPVPARLCCLVSFNAGSTSFHHSKSAKIKTTIKSNTKEWENKAVNDSNDHFSFIVSLFWL